MAQPFPSTCKALGSILGTPQENNMEDTCNPAEGTPQRNPKKSLCHPLPARQQPHPLQLLTFLGIEDAGLTQLTEEGAPTAGGLQVVQVEVGWVQPTGQVGEA